MTRTLLKWLFLLISIAVSATVAWFLYFNAGIDIKNSSASLQMGKKGAMFTDINLIQYDGHRAKWTLTSPKAERLNSSETVIYDPRLVLYREKVGPISVTAREGIYNTRTREVTFTREVMVDADGGRLKTRKLRFDPEARALSTDRPFEMISSHVRIQGEGLYVSHPRQLLKIRNRVKVIFPKGLNDISG
ncbi:LPS export ABC transporter periplasmic protein LptC [Magnetococcales bacterium HHB-1]